MTFPKYLCILFIDYVFVFVFLIETIMKSYLVFPFGLILESETNTKATDKFEIKPQHSAAAVRNMKRIVVKCARTEWC